MSLGVHGGSVRVSVCDECTVRFGTDKVLKTPRKRYELISSVLKDGVKPGIERCASICRAFIHLPGATKTIQLASSLPASIPAPRLFAILAADAAGYSRLMAMDDRLTMKLLVAARAVFRTACAEQQGRVA